MIANRLECGGIALIAFAQRPSEESTFGQAAKRRAPNRIRIPIARTPAWAG